MDYSSNYIPVPPVFWSFETGSLFARCALCSSDLLQEGSNYVIEKAMAQGEVIFEHAICLDCRDKMYDELSLKSRQLIENYFSEHVDISQRCHKMMENHGMNPDKWLDHCLVKGTAVSTLDEYQMYGYCVDSDLVFNEAPYVLSSQVIEDLLELISPETRGVIDEYSERLFGIDLPQGFVVL